MVTVFIPPLLRSLTQNVDRVEVPGKNVRQLIAALEDRFPGIRDRLCRGDALQPGIAVAVNGQMSSLGLIQKVPDGAEVHFLPPLGGG